MITILLSILVFGGIVSIHEFGHFFTAKLCGIKVNQFAIGMGPVLLKKQKGETEYSLRLFPIGGFCAMEGEDSDSDNPCSFNRKPVWQRMIVVLAGAFMNMILGFILILITTILYGNVITTQVVDFPKDKDTGVSISTSESCGLQINDQIISMNGMKVFTDTDLSYQLQTAESDTMDIVVRRNGQKVTLHNVKFHNTDTNIRQDFYVKAEEQTIPNVLSYSFLNTLSTSQSIWHSMVDLVHGKYGFQDLSGPVGIVSSIGEAASYGKTFRQHLLSLLSLASFITINVGIFNLLPIPTLDGARFVFLLVEAIRRKPVPPEKEGMVHFAGMAVLCLLLIAVTVQDIFHLLNP